MCIFLKLFKYSFCETYTEVNLYFVARVGVLEMKIKRLSSMMPIFSVINIGDVGKNIRSRHALQYSYRELACFFISCVATWCISCTDSDELEYSSYIRGIQVARNTIVNIHIVYADTTTS